MNNSRDKLSQFCTNNIIHQTPENIQETGVLDKENTGNYLKAYAPHFPSANMGSSIHVGFRYGQTMQSALPD